jgi:hypothetical protein
MRARIGLAPRRQGNIMMADTLCNWIRFAKRVDEFSEGAVLRLFKGDVVTALKFDADREVVAPLLSAPSRRTGMPGTQLTRYELHEFTVTPDQKMR